MFMPQTQPQCCHSPKRVHRVQRASCATTDFPFQKVYLASRGARRRVGLLALRWTRRSFACSKYQRRGFVYRNAEANSGGHYCQPEFSRSGRTSPCRCYRAARGSRHGNRTQIQGREGGRPGVPGCLDGEDSHRAPNAKRILRGQPIREPFPRPRQGRRSIWFFKDIFSTGAKLFGVRGYVAVKPISIPLMNGEVLPVIHMEKRT